MQSVVIRSLIVGALSFALVSFSSADEAVVDPSLVQLLRGDGEPATRLRAYGDFNLDGIRDVAVSKSLEYVSQTGLSFAVYLGDSLGAYVLYDNLWGWPESLACVEQDYRGIRIWSRGHVSASESIIGYHIMTDSGYVGGDWLTVFGGDGGGQISNAVANGIHMNPAVGLRVEKYRIVDGEVELLEYR